MRRKEGNAKLHAEKWFFYERLKADLRKDFQAGEMTVNGYRGEECVNRSPPLSRTRAANGQSPPGGQSRSDRRILETGEWGSCKLLLPEPRTILQAPNRERKAVGRLLQSFLWERCWVSTTPWLLPPSPQIRNGLRSNLGQLGAGVESRMEGKRRQSWGRGHPRFPISSEFSLPQCGQGSL